MLYAQIEIIPIPGILFDKKLLFKQHISFLSDKALRCKRALGPLLNRSSKLNLKKQQNFTLVLVLNI